MLELQAYDLRENRIAGPPHPSGRVVIVEVDDKTVTALGRYPFSRAEIAAVIDRLADSGAAVIGVDMAFNETSTAPADRALVDAVSAHRDRVVLSGSFSVQHVWRPLIGGLEQILTNAELGNGFGPPLASVEVDGSTRCIPIIWRDPPCTPFCVVVGGRYLHSRPHSDFGNCVFIGTRTIMCGYDGTIVVRPPDYAAAGDVLSFIDVRNGEFQAPRVKGRIVLVTPPHDRMYDPHVDPAFVQAAAIEQVMSGRPAVHVSPTVTCLVSAVIALALLVVFYRNTWWKSLVPALLFLVLYALLTLYLLATERLWIDVVLPLSCGLAVIVWVGLTESFYMKRLFAQILPHDLAQSFLESGDAGALAIVLDTARQMSTTLDADTLFDRLEQYLASTVPHDACAIYVTDVNTGEGACVRHSGLPLPEACPDRAMRVDDVRREPILQGLAETGLVSMLAVPMVVEGTSAGAVCLGSRQPAAFSRGHQDLVSTLAFHVAALLRNAQLHRQVIEAHRALDESKAQLVASSRLAAVGQLAAGAAHEINNPLGAVLLNIDSALLQLESKPDRARRKLESSKSALGRVRTIVEKLLDYSRQDVPYSPLSVNDVVRDALELQKANLDGDGIQVAVEYGEVPAIAGNAAQLQQVLINLLHNARDAIRFNPAGRRGEIRVVTRTDSDAVCVDVIDNGGGIAPEILERIFEPFFTTRPVGHGTGLGLWVSSRIVTDHRGTLTVDTRAGGPTRFTVRLGGS